MSATWVRFGGTELGHDPAEMDLDRGQAHEQVGGDLGVAVVLGDCQGDLALAGGQFRDRACGATAPVAKTASSLAVMRGESIASPRARARTA